MLLRQTARSTGGPSPLPSPQAGRDLSFSSVSVGQAAQPLHRLVLSDDICTCVARTVDDSVRQKSEEVTIVEDDGFGE